MTSAPVILGLGSLAARSLLATSQLIDTNGGLTELVLGGTGLGIAIARPVGRMPPPLEAP